MIFYLMDNFQKLYINLQKRMLHLETVIGGLQVEVKFLMQENADLKTENLALKAEIISFKDKLGVNSKNSSIPSSKELYKIKNENRKGSVLKQGAQAGHKGHVRDKPIADEIVKIPLASNECECG
jgi:transposase